MWDGLVAGDVTTVAPDGPESAVIREARREDLLSIHRIEQHSFPQPWPFSAFESYLGEPGFLVAVAEDEADAETDAVLGYVVADTVPNHGTPLGHVKDLAVAERHRDAGIGTALLSRSLDVLGEASAGSVKLEVRASNERAISLYRAFEFEHRRTIPNYYGNGEDALVMVHTME